MMKLQELREMTREELGHKKNDLVNERFNLQMRRSLKALDNPLRLRQIRREIAKINTVLREDELNIRNLADQTTSVLPQAGSKKKKQQDEKEPEK